MPSNILSYRSRVLTSLVCACAAFAGRTTAIITLTSVAKRCTILTPEALPKQRARGRPVARQGPFAASDTAECLLLGLSVRTRLANWWILPQIVPAWFQGRSPLRPAAVLKFSDRSAEVVAERFPIALGRLRVPCRLPRIARQPGVADRPHGAGKKTDERARSLLGHRAELNSNKLQPPREKRRTTVIRTPI